MAKSLVFQICLLYCNLWSFGAAANSMIYRQPFDFQNVPPDVKSTLPFSNAKFTSNGIPTSQQIMHTGRMVSHPLPNSEQYNVKNSNNNFDGILQMLNELSDEDIEQNKMRSAARDSPSNQHNYGYLPTTYSLPSTYAPSPSYGSKPESPSATQPKFSLIESLTSKSEGKVNGLVSLVLALLTGGSGKDNPVGKGIKDVIINGIVRPLLVAKGGIKTIISRLAIPVVSLILINVEVLITVWWLWDDCPAKLDPPPTPTPPPAPTYNYNNYSSSYL